MEVPEEIPSSDISTSVDADAPLELATQVRPHRRAKTNVRTAEPHQFGSAFARSLKPENFAGATVVNDLLRETLGVDGRVPRQQVSIEASQTPVNHIESVQLVSLAPLNSGQALERLGAGCDDVTTDSKTFSDCSPSSSHSFVSKNGEEKPLKGLKNMSSKNSSSGSNALGFIVGGIAVLALASLFGLDGKVSAWFQTFTAGDGAPGPVAQAIAAVAGWLNVSAPALTIGVAALGALRWFSPSTASLINDKVTGTVAFKAGLLLFCFNYLLGALSNFGHVLQGWVARKATAGLGSGFANFMQQPTRFTPVRAREHMNANQVLYQSPLTEAFADNLGSPLSDARKADEQRRLWGSVALVAAATLIVGGLFAHTQYDAFGFGSSDVAAAVASDVDAPAEETIAEGDVAALALSAFSAEAAQVGQSSVESFASTSSATETPAAVSFDAAPVVGQLAGLDD